MNSEIDEFIEQRKEEPQDPRYDPNPEDILAHMFSSHVKEYVMESSDAESSDAESSNTESSDAESSDAECCSQGDYESIFDWIEKHENEPIPEKFKYPGWQTDRNENE